MIRVIFNIGNHRDLMFGKKKKINKKIDKHENGGMKNGIIRSFV